MSKKITVTEIENRIRQVHGDVVVLDISTYTDTHTKALFIDKDRGEWWASPKNVYGLKNGHPDKRGQKISKTKTLSFKTIHPTAELWNKKKLKNMGIL